MGMLESLDVVEAISDDSHFLTLGTQASHDQELVLGVGAGNDADLVDRLITYA